MGKPLKAIGSMFSPLMAATSLFKRKGKRNNDQAPMTPSLPDPEDPVARLEITKRLRERAKQGRAGTIYSNSRLGGTV